MLNSVEGLLEVYEDMVDVLLVLEIFLTEDSQVEDLLCSAASCSETCLFFSNDLFCLRLKPVQYDLQHEFAWGWLFFCLPGLLADCHESISYFLSNRLDKFC